MYFLQYYRIVRGIKRLKITYNVIMILIVIWTFGQLLITATQCIPIAALWDKTILDAKCTQLSPVALSWMPAIGNIVTDVIILVLPLPVVWRLKLPRQQKIGLLAVFCLGFV
jgi:hypothetical protein